METADAIYLVEEARTLDELRGKVAERRASGWEPLGRPQSLPTTGPSDPRYTQTVYKFSKDNVPGAVRWKF